MAAGSPGSVGGMSGSVEELTCTQAVFLPSSVPGRPHTKGIGVYMAQLQMPRGIWESADSDERDSYFLSAGFDPNLPVVDNGTDASTVRFRQDIEEVAMVLPIMQPGDDTRDYEKLGASPSMPAPIDGLEHLTGGPGLQPMIQPLVTGYLALAGQALRLILGGGGGRLTRAIWNNLPPLLRTALTQVGIGVGVMIAFSGDIPFVPKLFDRNGDFDPGQEGGGIISGGTVDIEIAPSPFQGVQIVGTPWVANGVTFYRLSDGKLAVKNKKGRWKVWRPKKPIVLYADGASNLKTMLRADKALNKQAKKIAAMLNRRAPKRRTSKKDDQPTIIVQGSGRVIDN